MRWPLAAHRHARPEDGAAGRAAFDRLWSEDVVVEQYFDIVADVADGKGQTDLAARARAFGRGADITPPEHAA